jgi:hypothetical protein
MRTYPWLRRRRVGWALSSLCFSLSAACDLSDPSADGSERSGAAGGGGASAAGRSDEVAPASAAPVPSGVDAPSSEESPDVGGLAGIDEQTSADDAVEGVAADAGSEAPAADAGVVQAPADAGIDPALDDNVVFIQQDGFQTTYFAQECRSIGEDGSVIEGEPLPVGDGNALECITSTIGALATTDFLSSIDERWCALGALDTFSTGGDPALVIQVVDSPDDAPWTLVGVHEGEPIEIGRVAVFGGATAWPLWVDTHYAVIDVVPNPTGQLCDALFGL